METTLKELENKVKVMEHRKPGTHRSVAPGSLHSPRSDHISEDPLESDKEKPEGLLKDGKRSTLINYVSIFEFQSKCSAMNQNFDRVDELIKELFALVGTKIDKVDLENLTEHKVSKEEVQQLIPSLEMIENKINIIVEESNEDVMLQVN